MRDILLDPTLFPITMITIALLLLLYGVAWHDQPARPAVIERHTNRKRRPQKKTGIRQAL